MASNDIVDTTKSYYDSEGADNFYHTIWGGEDIHVGLYYNEEDTIYEASIRTVKMMVDMLDLTKDKKVLDVGAGYGGSARYMAKHYGCHVTCLNLSDAENERNVQKNKDQGLDHLIDVKGGNFEDLPYDDEAFDIVWCQDSLLHSDRRDVIFKEVHRVLKPGGDWIFTDPMQKAEDTDKEVLKPVYNRLHLNSLGSVPYYRRIAPDIGFEEVEIKEMPEQLVNHYSNVRKELQKNYDLLVERCGQDYVDRMNEGLGHWVDKGERGYLNWGVLHFRKKK